MFGTAFAVSVLAAFLFSGTASAGTYYYCGGCSIGSNGVYRAAGYVYINLDYVHRLSGPGSGVVIGAAAQYADNGAWSSWSTSTATEVTRGFSGTRPAWGAAGNFGAGTYGFNAHANY